MSVKFTDRSQARHFFNTKGNSTEARQVTTNSNLQDIETNTDSCASSLNDMKEHTGLSATRLLNIANHLTQDGLGGGNSHGVMLDSCSSRLGDISSNSTLTASRLNNIQNHLTQDGLGGGNSHGVMLDSCSSKLGDISSNSVLTASRLNNIQNYTIYLDPTENKKTATAIYTSSTTITDTNFINGGASIDTQGYSSVRFYGETTTSYAFHGQISDDDSNFFPSSNLAIYPSQVQGSTNYYFDTKYDNPPRYIKLKNDSGYSITFEDLRYTLFP